MMVPSTKSVLKHFDSASEEIKRYFQHLPAIVTSFPWEVAIAYQFIRVEQAQNRALYGGAVKLHRADAELAGSMLDSLHITRGSFLTHYETVFGQPIPPSTVTKLKFAENIRDKTVHGKAVSDADFRQAVVDVIDYAASLNDHVGSVAGFKPFGDMRGFKGAAQPLEKATTRWLLKGLLSS